ncbi:MAG TPA: GxxExxY protein [Synergistales bacterium]|nr:GxxExxY protein [Synergistales bacterium]HOI82443.1 GxxExxY protein [Synergistales bacterium]
MEVLNNISGQIIKGAIEVHKQLGPGLLESTYEGCLIYELVDSGLSVQSQVPFPVKYKGKLIDIGYRVDLLVEGIVVVELKSVERLLPIHSAQILTYLKLSDLKVGLLINFNAQKIKDGIRRFINT